MEKERDTLRTKLEKEQERLKKIQGSASTKIGRLGNEVRDLTAKNAHLEGKLARQSKKIEHIDTISEAADKYRLEAESVQMRLWTLNRALEGNLPVSFETEQKLAIQEQAIQALNSELLDAQEHLKFASTEHNRIMDCNAKQVDDLREKIHFQQCQLAVKNGTTDYHEAMEALNAIYTCKLNNIQQYLEEERASKDSFIEKLNEATDVMAEQASTISQLEFEIVSLKESLEEQTNTAQNAQQSEKTTLSVLNKLEAATYKGRYGLILRKKDFQITSMTEKITELEQVKDHLEETEYLRRRAACEEFQILTISEKRERQLVARLAFAENELQKLPVNPMLKYTVDPRKWEPKDWVWKPENYEEKEEYGGEDEEVEEPDYSQVPPGDDNFPPRQDQNDPEDRKGKSPMYPTPPRGMPTPPDTPASVEQYGRE